MSAAKRRVWVGACGHVVTLRWWLTSRQAWRGRCTTCQRDTDVRPEVRPARRRVRGR